MGVAAPIASAVFNATGVRIRDLPIPLDKPPRPGASEVADPYTRSQARLRLRGVLEDG